MVFRARSVPKSPVDSKEHLNNKAAIIDDERREFPP